jgi:hypothetical protein
VRDASALGGGPYHFSDKSSRSAAASSICSAEASSASRSPPPAPSPLGLGNVHAAVFSLPIVKRCLLCRKSCSLNPSVLRQAGL